MFRSALSPAAARPEDDSSATVAGRGNDGAVDAADFIVVSDWEMLGLPPLELTDTVTV